MKHLVLISLLFTSTLFADFNVGDTLPHITLKDQFNKEFTVEAKDTLLIMAFEKDVSVALNKYLKKQPGTYLVSHHAKYISDISAMPSFITSLFALPKMKKYPFSVMLIKNHFGKLFNHQKGKITLYTLKKHKITHIRYVSPKSFASLFL